MIFLMIFGFGSTGTTIDNIALHQIASHNDKFLFVDSIAATALVTWTTSMPTTSRIQYGLSAGNLDLDSGTDPLFTTNHVMHIQYRLEAGKTYFYQISGSDQDGNPVSSAILSFVTPNPSEFWQTGHDRYYKRNDFQTETRWIGGLTYFRYSFSLNQLPVAAWLQTNRWKRFEGGIKIWVNGTFIGMWSMGYLLKTFDISSQLVNGNNVIALEVQQSEPTQLLLDGEVLLADDALFPLSSKSVGWKTSALFEPGWELPGLNDNAWSSVSLGSVPSPTSGFYSPHLLAELPAETPLNQPFLRYTRALAGQNRILAQGLIRYRQDRQGLDLQEKSLADDLARSCLDTLYALQSDLDGAGQALAMNDGTAATPFLDSAELSLETAKDLAQAATDYLTLIGELQTLVDVAALTGQNGLDPIIQQVQIALPSLTSSLQMGDTTTALPLLTSWIRQIQTQKKRFQCAQDGRFSAHNDSGWSPFGWIRSRGLDLDPLFWGDYNWDTLQLNLDSAPAFCGVPGYLDPLLRDSIQFISPMIGLQTNADSLDLAPNMSHIAFWLNGSPEIRPTNPGNLYNLGEGTWSQNGLLVWDQSAANRVYVLVLEHQPDSIDRVDNKIRLTRSGGLGSLILLPFYPQGQNISSDTSAIATWGSGLPMAVINDWNTWIPIMVHYPIGYSEWYGQDSMTGMGQVQMRYRYRDLNDDWATASQDIAPLPNALVLALAGNYSGLSVAQPQTDSRMVMSGWGSYQWVAGDQLQYNFPLLNPNPRNGVNEPVTKGFMRPTDMQNSGFNAIRGQLILQDESGNFTLRSDWQTRLNQALTEANNAGLWAVFFVWNNGGNLDGLESDPIKRQNFIDSWGQIAAEASTYNVVYDLTNEPKFTSASNYSDLMAMTCASIRAFDMVNPISIEGFRNYAQTFEGMIHPADLITGLDNIWYQFHPYNNTLDSNTSAIDQYYPGRLQSWYENSYIDRDAYVASRWIPALRTLWTDDRIRLINGEYGFQDLPAGVAEAMAADTVSLAQRFQTDQLAFVSTGWAGFDLYGGQGDTFQERDEITEILAELNSWPGTRFCQFLTDLPLWQTNNLTQCQVSNPNCLAYIALINNQFLCSE
ncbi:MAG: hypothetical protein KDC71_16555 [Acidobacteria bacterium]|nr:hypothetical protein [Acidobacteriota bacterium]